MKSELRPTDDWSEKAITQCRELITSENVVHVHYDIKEEREDCFFGIVVLQTLPPKSNKYSNMNIAEVLALISEAVQTDFDAGMLNILMNI